MKKQNSPQTKQSGIGSLHKSNNHSNVTPTAKSVSEVDKTEDTTQQIKEEWDNGYYRGLEDGRTQALEEVEKFLKIIKGRMVDAVGLYNTGSLRKDDLIITHNRIRDKIEELKSKIKEMK